VAVKSSSQPDSLQDRSKGKEMDLAKERATVKVLVKRCTPKA
jgi:hypothetical protein